MVEALLNALIFKGIDEAMRGDNGYKRQVWEYAREKVQAVTTPQGFIVHEKHCKSKHDNLKEDWKMWEALHNLSGFSQRDNGCVDGESRAVKAYFQAHPRAKKFENTPLEFPELHYRLFAGQYATGRNVLTATEALEDEEEEEVPMQSVEVERPRGLKRRAATPEESTTSRRRR